LAAFDGEGGQLSATGAAGNSYTDGNGNPWQYLASVIPVGEIADAFGVGDLGSVFADAGGAGDASTAGGADAADAGGAGDGGDAGAQDGQPPCTVPGGSSFNAATLVVLASGKKVLISSLRPGDKVQAADTKTGKDQAETVTAVLVHHDTDLYDLTVKTSPGSGRDGGVRIPVVRPVGQSHRHVRHHDGDAGVPVRLE
jgi:hypothetical protein